MPKTWNTVAIIGVGLIGGSIGLALRERKLARRVVGIGRKQSSLAAALAHGCITEATTDLAAGLANAELIVVCTPVDSIVDFVQRAAAYAHPGALITDAGSTKEQIASAIDGRLPFVGSHPLAGSDKSGPEAASSSLFEGRMVVTTPTALTQKSVVEPIEQFWQSLGARIIRMSPAEHDAALARTSHLPHLVASALAAATPAEVLPLTATGWQDTTRVAAGDVELWRQIFLANRASTLKALTDFETVLARFRAALEAADAEPLEELLAEGKRRRDALGS